MVPTEFLQLYPLLLPLLVHVDQDLGPVTAVLLVEVVPEEKAVSLRVDLFQLFTLKDRSSELVTVLTVSPRLYELPVVSPVGVVSTGNTF